MAKMKMKKKDITSSLKEIVKEYRSIHGEGQSELSMWNFGLDIFDKNKNLSDIARDLAPEENLKGKYALKIVNNLEEEGFIVGKNHRYNLTKIGYEVGSRTFIQSGLTFLNKNPGLLSLLAIFISVVALCVSLTKP